MGQHQISSLKETKNHNLQYIIRHTIKMPEEKSSRDHRRARCKPPTSRRPSSSIRLELRTRTVNVKAGERQAELPNSEVSDTGLEGAATKGSGVREEGGADLSKVGREG